MSQSCDLFPEPPERLASLHLRNTFSFIGPGLIIASVTIGSGELVWASRAGAVFGYQLLWCFLLAGIFKAVQVYGAARHLTLTGEHPMVSWKAIPGPPLWFPLLIALPTVLVMPIAFSSISEILGGYLRELTGISMSNQPVGPFDGFEFWQNVWGGAVLTICFILAISSTLKTLERVSAVVLGLIIVCATISVIVCKPNVADFLAGLFIPLVPDYEPWVVTEYANTFAGRSPWLEVALYLSAVGGGTFDYIGYVGMIREKKWGLAGSKVASCDQLELIDDDQVTRAKIWTRAAMLDTGISFTSVILVTLLFAVLGALLLHTEQRIPDNTTLLSEQETFLTQLHPWLLWLYPVGVFLAFIGTLYGAFEIYRYTVVESARSLLPKWTTDKHVPIWRNLTVAYCYGGGMIMIWLPKQVAGNVLDRMTFGAVIGGATLCGLWCFAMLWINHVRLPRVLRMSWPLWVSTLIAGIAMTALGVQTLLVYF
ncbi:manganese transport protein MntH [Gimesia alba]|uniref:Manganese transport protein MntH n=1 Tax=Gimesia alba TaxID=2527973 RepID=A0A517RCY3_9PLAN|nr:Nramp family divalent metal transporter [Gimesia alba]QDT41742.1 manganese transport protein MntH [Gimesia alba]